MERVKEYALFLRTCNGRINTTTTADPQVALKGYTDGLTRLVMGDTDLNRTRRGAKPLHIVEVRLTMYDKNLQVIRTITSGEFVCEH